MRRLLLAVLAMLVVPSSASAAVFTVGTGFKPAIAVDPVGTAYVAWYGTETTGDVSLHFCRFPRGAEACDVSTTLTPAGATLSRPFIRVSGSRVDIVDSRYGFATGTFDQTLQFTSTDGGATFSGSSVAGTVQFDESVAGPGDAVTVATNANTGGGLVQFMPLSGPAATTAANLFPATYLYNGAVGLSGPTVVAVFTDAIGQAQFRTFRGGDYNDAASWSPAAAVGYAAYPHLAGGSRGLFMLAGNARGGLEVRRWTGTGFGAPVAVAARGGAPESHLYQDGGGRLHAVWPSNEADGYHLEHAVSDDRGATWRTETVTTQTLDQENALRVAAAADHAGFAVWTSRVNGTSQVQLAPIAAGPVFHKSVTVSRVSGTVRVRRPGSPAFVTLTGSDTIPLRSTVDAKNGRLELSSVRKKGGAAQTAQFYSGVFKVAQPGAVTELRLTETLASCRGAAAAAKKPKTRKLWGDGSGSFRTRGQFSAATVRGTRWLVQDSCAGTLTRVVKGAVTVRDFARAKTIVVRAGRTYLAKRR